MLELTLPISTIAKSLDMSEEKIEKKLKKIILINKIL